MGGPRPLVVCGPSGVGKGTLIARLTVRARAAPAQNTPPRPYFARAFAPRAARTAALPLTPPCPLCSLPWWQEAHPALFGFSVSHTTRAPRPGEQDGVHYHFTDRDAFLAGVAEGACACRAPRGAAVAPLRFRLAPQRRARRITRACAASRATPADARAARAAAGKFLEHAHVHGNIYGTSFAAVAVVTGASKVCILDVDVQGAEAVKAAALGAAFVFVSPPSMAELERRLRGRGTETEEKIGVRLANAAAEMAKCEVPGFFDAVVVNDELESAFGRLKGALRCASAVGMGFACVCVCVCVRGR
jgi:guanylate kinase